MKTFKLSLFEAFGVELEYMIVDKTTLDVKPVADKLFEDVLGYSGNEVDLPLVSWSNELARHVVEIKTSEPIADFSGLLQGFNNNIRLINEKLDKYHAVVLPGAAHPWMNPLKETVLWQHENSEIYDTYNKIFNCSGHGWSNLQSTHINLPFANDEEFGRLHAAIRLIMPIIPALSASSPVLDGTSTGWHDTRLKYYQKNQAMIPSITGKVIPEAVFSQKDYQEKVFDVISRDIAPHDPNGILEPIWLNSRGAIARFDRGAIEIRIIDIQECPSADLAILSLIIGALQLLSKEVLLPYNKQISWDAEKLHELLNKIAKSGEETIIDQQEYLQIFGVKHPISVKELWQHFSEIVMKQNMVDLNMWEKQLSVILNQGSLATRLLKALDGNFHSSRLKEIYGDMASCLANNNMFVP